MPIGPFTAAARQMTGAAPGADAGNADAERACVFAAVQVLLAAAEGQDYQRAGLLRTPDRFAAAWQEMMRGYAADPAEILGVEFASEGYDEIVLESFPFHSTCEHHLLPFRGIAHVGYLPDGKVTGVSKLVRIVTDCYAPRLQMQERITVQTADAIMDVLEARGAIVVMRATHSCVECRGVGVPDARTTTSAVRGVFRDKPEARAEAFALIHRSHP